jgi:hypothetical protein
MEYGEAMKKFRYNFFLYIILSHQISYATDCHPKINPKLPQYIVGYGSLMNEQSKRRTDPTAEANFPVYISGYERSWSVHGNLPGLNTTFLSVFKNRLAAFNGVIYKLGNPKNIQQYDQRESVYCREELSTHQLKIYSGTLPSAKQIWIYTALPKLNNPPTQEVPIVQSYVDTFMSGCIQIKENFNLNNFAEDCVKTTQQWSTHWENDRIFPRRPFLHEPYAGQIDAILKKLLPEEFKQIQYKSPVF